MTTPIQYCSMCDRSRDCTLHLGSRVPPKAAKDWLKMTCPVARKGEPRPCVISYRAGILPGSRVRGQG